MEWSNSANPLPHSEIRQLIFRVRKTKTYERATTVLTSITFEHLIKLWHSSQHRTLCDPGWRHYLIDMTKSEPQKKKTRNFVNNLSAFPNILKLILCNKKIINNHTSNHSCSFPLQTIFPPSPSCIYLHSPAGSWIIEVKSYCLIAPEIWVKWLHLKKCLSSYPSV